MQPFNAIHDLSFTFVVPLQLFAYVFLKSGSHLQRNCFIENPFKMMKNAFYFILKALFVLKIFKFLSRLFGHVEKTA